MKALQYRRSVVRYALLKLLGPGFPRLYSSALSPVSLRDIREPELPTPQWARVAPRLTSVCGSDVATLSCQGSPYFAPVTSMPFVLGHEVVGTVTEVGREVWSVREGDRVVLHPALGCRVRGVAPPCEACREGKDALCRNVTRGDVSAGIQTGYCRDTGGGWGETFVAHQSQLCKVPDELEDRAAVLIEPFACSLHGTLRVRPHREDVILVVGCGSIGLLTIAALRATGCESRIVAVAKHEHQKEHARRLGANELAPSGGRTWDRYVWWGEALNAEVLKPELGKPTVIGGADVTFDCVASSQSIDDSIRFTKSGGTLVLVGMPAIPQGIDWTPLWFKELTLHAAYAYGPECHDDDNRDTFGIAIDLMHTWAAKLVPLVSEPFDLADYRAAFAAALNTGKSRAVKIVFAVNRAKG
ncbi:MAG: alcohol dehydrogenase catalytic domain-containing protein [Phycisphaerales bacterium]|nr:MAG: alcohol dehydrogenase catalytic domain-containing protein [Phycisphaerales bacterium]